MYSRLKCNHKYFLLRTETVPIYSIKYTQDYVYHESL